MVSCTSPFELVRLILNPCCKNTGVFEVGIFFREFEHIFDYLRLLLVIGSGVQVREPWVLTPHFSLVPRQKKPVNYSQFEDSDSDGKWNLFLCKDVQLHFLGMCATFVAHR